MFTIALFIIVETSQCPMTYRQIHWGLFLPRNIFNNEKKWNANTCYNMDESWKCEVMWKKPITKDYLIHYYI
jgi:hypothetical protein